MLGSAWMGKSAATKSIKAGVAEKKHTKCAIEDYSQASVG